MTILQVPLTPRPVRRDLGPYRVAIVGCGPRGLWALQSLVGKLGDEPIGRSVAITVVEPHASPGAGWVYDPGQPSCQRMNLANRHVNASAGQDWSYLDWCRQNGLPADGEGFDPRASVGRYFAACFERTIAALPPGVQVEVKRDRAVRMTQSPLGWQLRLSSGDRITADDVLLTVGHGTSGPADQRPADIAGIYPTQRKLDETAVPTGCRVALRGFALTGIDAILSLTEGRGGRFVPQGDGTLTYESSGREPAVIHAFSRTGQPMAVKPSKRVNEARGAAAIWARVRDEIDQTPPTAATIESLVIDAAAARYKLEHGSQRQPTGSLWQQLRDRSRTPRPIDSVTEDWTRSLEVAAGREPIDFDQALGAAWRMVYPSIVEAVGFGGLPCDEVAAFQAMAARFERLAFGPPAASVRRLLALARSGHLSFDHATDPDVMPTADGWLLNDTAVDVLIDARIGSPGVRPMPTDGYADEAHGRRESLIASLVRQEIVAVDEAWQAIQVDRAGFAADRLAIIGRVTEGWVLGHDTVTRSMHDQIPNWAVAVAKRTTATGTAAVPVAAAAR